MKIVFICFLVCSVSVHAQPLTLSGENFMVLDGERFKKQKIVLTKADGDWFASDNDGHGTIEFDAMYSNRKLKLYIEWDGKEPVHAINNEIRHEQRKGDFLISMDDKAVYGDGLNAYPSGEDQVKIIIHSIDDAKLSGELSGMITQGNEEVKVSGTFSLQKKQTPASGKKVVTLSYKDYDNVVHDKLTGAENRSPSESEAQYDLDVRQTLRDAFRLVISSLQRDAWQIDEQTGLEPLDGVQRGSEKQLFNTTYNLRLSLTQASPVFAHYMEKINELTEKSRNNPTKENFEEVMKVGHEMNGATHISIAAFVNNHSASFSNFKGGIKVSTIADNVFKIQGPSMRGRTGGGEDNSVDATIFLIGKWKQPVVQKLDEKESEVNSTAIVNNSPTQLKAQNVVIRIECSPALAEQIIKNLDIEKLRLMVK